MSTDVSGKKIFKRVLRGKELSYVERNGEKRLLTGSFFTGNLLTGGTGSDTRVITAQKSTPGAFVTTVKNIYRYLAQYITGDEPAPVVSETEDTNVYKILDIRVDYEDKRYKPEADPSFDLSKERAGYVWGIAYQKAKEKEGEILDAGYGWVTGYKDGESLEPENIRDRGDYRVDPVSAGWSGWDASCNGGYYKGEKGEADCDLFLESGDWVVFTEMAAGANVHGKLTVEASLLLFNQHYREESYAYPGEIEIPVVATVITMPGKFTNEMYPVGTKAVVAQTIDLGSVTATMGFEGYRGSLVIEDFVFQIPESKFVKIVIRSTLDPNEGMQKYCFGHPAGESASWFSSSLSCRVVPDYDFIQVGDTPR